VTAPAATGGLALLGGAFNPPHRSHRRIAIAALAQLPVESLLVLPTGRHPLKHAGDLAPPEHRLAMCRLAFGDLAHVAVDDRELARSGPSYTVATLDELRAEAPSRPLWFLIGADNLRSLPSWRDHHRLLSLCSIAVVPRLGVAIDERALAGLDLTAAERRHLLAHVLEMPADDLSASDLRRRLAGGERNLPELPDGVERYLLAARLYGT
jgi:nicotinate-nucleotide adenylyltransferase